MVSLLGREAVAEKLVVLCGSVGWSASVEKVLVVGCFRFLVAGWKRKSARRAGGGVSAVLGCGWTGLCVLS